MEEKYYLYFLIFCASFTHAFGIPLEENIKKSSDLLVRRKRLIDTTPNGNKPVNLRQVPYIVNVLKNGFSHCGGTILETSIILTAAHCITSKNDNTTYSVLSGSSFRNHGILHTIRRIIKHPQYNRRCCPNDLALLIIYPPINLQDSSNQRIKLHPGPIQPNTNGTFSGWGSFYETMIERRFPNELRSITVPTISQQDCNNIYGAFIPITNKEICVLDRSGQKGSSYGDFGGPLVVNGLLAGVMAWRRNMLNGYDPDVFMNVANPEYRAWIILNILQIGI